MKDSLIFPEEILRQHLVVIGKTGAGKSSALRHIVEHLLRQQKRVCIIDPKGDWCGLKVSADGKSPGFPVILFGSFKEPIPADVPLNEYSGKHIAELVTSGNRPCVVGFRGWTQGHMTKFWIDFASTLFNSNAGELYLVVDEVHNFAPKGKILSPEAGMCLHWSNRIMNEGRGIGLVNLIASQRPQKVHNDTLTACETLVAMRVVHTSDRAAVEDWIKGCGDAEQGKEVLNSLAGMSRGEAFVWSPEAQFGPVRLRFPMFATFDSFAPPQLQKKVSEKGWAGVDLTEVKAKLAAVIEEQKANDPKELKRQIAELRNQLNSRAPVVDQTAIERAVSAAVGQVEKQYKEIIAADRKSLSDLAGRLKKIEDLAHLNGDAPKPLALPERAPLRVTRPVAMRAPVHTRQVPSDGNAELGTGGLRRMMIALAQRPQGMSAKQLGVRAQLSSSSGTFDTYLSKGRSMGWIEGTKRHMAITDAGLDALGNYEPLPTGRELLNYWLGKLGSSGASRMLSVLAESHPTSLPKDELAARAGLSLSGTFDTYLSKLRTLELIEGRGEMKASDELFD